MTCFPHTVYQGIRDETITAGGSDVRGMADFQPGARAVENLASFSCGVEAVDDGMRSSRSGRGRQHLADTSRRPKLQRRATATRPHQTKQRVCEPRAPFPAFSPTLSECYRPGMVRPKRVSWFHPPGGCAMGGRDVVSPEKRPYFWINVRHGYQRVCRAVVHPVCAPLTVYDTGTVTTLYTCSTAKALHA